MPTIYITYVTLIFCTSQLCHICDMFFFKKFYLKPSSVDIFPLCYTKEVAGQSFYVAAHPKIQKCEALEMCTTRLSWSKMKSDFFSCFFTLIKCTFTDGKPIFNTTVENNTNQIAFSQRLIDQSFKLLICLQEPYKVL